MRHSPIQYLKGNGGKQIATPKTLILSAVTDKLREKADAAEITDSVIAILLFHMRQNGYDIHVEQDKVLGDSDFLFIEANQ